MLSLSVPSLMGVELKLSQFWPVLLNKVGSKIAMNVDLLHETWNTKLGVTNALACPYHITHKVSRTINTHSLSSSYRVKKLLESCYYSSSAPLKAEFDGVGVVLGHRVSRLRTS